MNIPYNPASIVLLGLLLCACQQSDTNGTFTHFSVVDSSHVAIHARAAPDAILAVDGSLQIHDKLVPLTPSQQSLLRGFYVDIETLRRDAIATGKSGIATAATALSSVARGLATGDTDNINREVEAKASKVDAAATKVCFDLARLREKQEAIVAQLDSFRPYALLEASDTARCGG